MGVLQGIASKLWCGFWYTRAQCLSNERELLDNLLRDTGLRWTGRDTRVRDVRTADCSDDPADVVRSVSVNESHPGGVDLVCIHGFGQSGATAQNSACQQAALPAMRPAASSILAAASCCG